MPANVPFSTTWQGTMTAVIPSYLYTEYADDEDLQAFVDAYNQIAQEYIDWFNGIGLPIYTGRMIVGDLLDWVAEGLYGVARPTISTGTVSRIGPYNTYAYNTLGFNYSRVLANVTYFTANDDIYKRLITWQHYKGDGFYFCISWLKRRVMRFIDGVNGTDPATSTNNLQDVSVVFTGTSEFEIKIFNSADHSGAQAFAACVADGILNLPFQITFTVALL